MIGGAFEVIRANAPPATLAGAGGRFIDLHDWLQLTLGRFLAPPRESGSEVEFLILGEADQGESAQADARDEVTRFREAITAVGEHLREQIDSEALCRSHVLLSLEALLGLTLPDPSDDAAWHLRGGLLQVCNWGLAGGTTLGQIIADIKSSRRGEEPPFFRHIRATLERNYGALPKPINGASRGDYLIPAPDPQPPPALPTAHSTRDPHLALQELAIGSPLATGRPTTAAESPPTIYMDEDSSDSAEHAAGPLAAVRKYVQIAPTWVLAACAVGFVLLGIGVGVLVAPSLGRSAASPAGSGSGLSSGHDSQRQDNEAGRFGMPQRESPGR